jgi:hypothetical protein
MRQRVVCKISQNYQYGHVNGQPIKTDLNVSTIVWCLLKISKHPIVPQNFDFHENIMPNMLAKKVTAQVNF